MKRFVVVSGLLACTLGCRRGRRAPWPRDPRLEFATACPDPRYVNAPAVSIPTVGAGEVRSVATTRFSGRRYVAWVTDDGAALWREGASVATRVTPPIPGGAFAMDATATRLLLAWASREGQVLVAAIDPSGATRAFPPWGSGVTELALAARPDGAVVVWRDAQGLMVRLLDPDGTPSGPPTFLASSPADAPSVTWSAGCWTAVWRVVAGGLGILRMRTIGRDGALHGQAVDAVRTDGSLGPPSVRWGGGRLALAWSDARNGDRGLQCTTVDRAGHTQSEPQRLSIRFAEGARASIAWDGAAFGVTWWEPVQGGVPRSFFALVDRTGRRIGTGMRVLSDDVPLTTPVVDWERPQYVLVVARGREVELRRTGPLGCDFPPYVPPPSGPVRSTPH